MIVLLACDQFHAPRIAEIVLIAVFAIVWTAVWWVRENEVEVDVLKQEEHED